VSKEIIGLDPLLVDGPKTILERTLVAEYLLSKGYLISELDGLSPKVAQILLKEACQFTVLKLAEIEVRERFPWETRMRFSLN